MDEDIQVMQDGGASRDDSRGLLQDGESEKLQDKGQRKPDFFQETWPHWGTKKTKSH